MRLVRYLLPFTVFVSACAPAVTPIVRDPETTSRVPLLGSSLTVKLSGGLTTQALPALWDEAEIAVDSPNLVERLTSNRLPFGGGPLSKTFNVPPGPASVEVTLYVNNEAVATGTAEAVLEVGANSVTVELSTLSPTLVTLAGSPEPGSDDGFGLAASFNSPRGVTLDEFGNLYVADYGNSRIRRIDPTTGEVTTLAGAEPGFVNGSGYFGATVGTARFNQPSGLAYSATIGKLFVSDTGNHAIRVIDLRKPSTDPNFVTTLAGSGQPGFLNAGGPLATFNRPEGIAFHDSIVYVADSLNHAIRRVDASGSVQTLAGGTEGMLDTTLSGAQFHTPRGLTVVASGDIYVADTGNHRLRRISETHVETVAGNYDAGSTVGTGGVGGSTRFSGLQSVLWGGWSTESGSLFILEETNHRIVRVDLGKPPTDAEFVTQFLGGLTPGWADGAHTTVRFNAPFGMAVERVDPLNNPVATTFYVADTLNHRIARGVFALLGPGRP